MANGTALRLLPRNTSLASRHRTASGLLGRVRSSPTRQGSPGRSIGLTRKARQLLRRAGTSGAAERRPAEAPTFSEGAADQISPLRGKRAASQKAIDDRTLARVRCGLRIGRHGRLSSQRLPNAPADSRVGGLERTPRSPTDALEMRAAPRTRTWGPDWIRLVCCSLASAVRCRSGAAGRRCRRRRGRGRSQIGGTVGRGV